MTRGSTAGLAAAIAADARFTVTALSAGVVPPPPPALIPVTGIFWSSSLSAGVVPPPPPALIPVTGIFWSALILVFTVIALRHHLNHHRTPRNGEAPS